MVNETIVGFIINSNETINGLDQEIKMLKANQSDLTKQTSSIMDQLKGGKESFKQLEKNTSTLREELNLLKNETRINEKEINDLKNQTENSKTELEKVKEGRTIFLIILVTVNSGHLRTY